MKDGVASTTALSFAGLVQLTTTKDSSRVSIENEGWCCVNDSALVHRFRV